MGFEFEVIQGIVPINSIVTVQLTPEVFCFYIDFKSKYVEYEGTLYGSDQIEFMFGTNEHTLYTRKTKLGTYSSVKLSLPDDWKGIVTYGVRMGRYVAKVFMVKMLPDFDSKLPYYESKETFNVD
jgi:hypothetical protein